MDKATMLRKRAAARAKLRKAGVEPTEHLIERTLEGMYVPPDPRLPGGYNRTTTASSSSTFSGGASA